MKSPNTVKEEIFDYLYEDWIPLHAIVLKFIGYGKEKPEREEFLEILKFIAKLLDKENIICLEGPDMTKVNGSGKEITNWILELYEKEGYGQINYGIWFDKGD